MAIRPVALLVLAAPDVIEVPLQVAQHYQIQKTIVIQVHPGRARRPPSAGDPGLLSDIRESAIPVVVV
jgi:hypothetical protein